MPVGCVTRHSETSQEDTHRRKAICLLDVPRYILKCHEKIHTGESHLPPGCTKRHSEMSQEETYRRKALCLQDVSRDILKGHEKIHTGEKPFACTMYQDTF